MSLQIAQNAGLVSVNTTSTAKSVDLPLASQRQGRIVTIKDGYGFANINPITINATGGNTFENGSTTYTINKSFGSITVVAKGSVWVITSEINQGLPSTIDGLATFGYISSPSLQSTMVGLNTSFTTSSLTVSSISFGNDFGFLNLGNLQTDVLSSQRIYTSTINVDGSLFLYDKQLTGYGNITLSNQTLYINGNAITGGGGGGGSGDVTSTNLTSTTLGLGTLGYISSTQLASSLRSTVAGLATIGYVSSSQLTSTTFGITSNYSTFLSTTLATYSFPYSGEVLYLNYSISNAPYATLSTSNIAGPSYSNVFSVTSNTSNNFVVGFQSDFFAPLFIPTGLWTTHLFSEADAAGVSVYASIFQRTSGGTETLIATSSNSPQIVPLSKVSLFLTADVPYTELNGNSIVLKIFANNTTNQNRTLKTYYENGNYSYVDTTLGFTVQNVAITSSLQGLGTMGYISSTQLASSLQSTVRGLGTMGYISSTQLASSLQSTVAGLGTMGYISSTQLASSLQSTVRGLGTIGYLSSLTLSSLVSTPFLDTTLQSTVRGLGTFAYLSAGTTTLISSPVLDTTLQSTVRGLGTLGYVSTAVLESTVRGLGTTGYISSAQLLSTTAAYRTSFTTASSVTSSLTASTINSVQGYVSSLTVDVLTVGTGTGWINMGPIQATAVSSIQENTGSLYATTIYVGNTSTLNQIRYWGLFGNYNNTILAEVSTGTAVGAQEFLVFKGSSASDRIRFQTTGDIRFEPQVAAREFSTATALATPTMILQSNLVGLNTASPVALLDVRGTAFATTLSTQQAFVSSLNGVAFANLISSAVLDSTLQSTVRGLGTFGYLSAGTTTLVSSPFLDTALASTARGLGTFGYLSAGTTTLISSPFLETTLRSTLNGLATFAYVSSASLQSSMVGMNRSFTTSSLTVSSISFGNDFGFLNLGNLQTDVLSSLRIYTSTINVDGSLFLYDKQLTGYGNITLSNNTLYINGNAITAGGGGGSGDVTSTNLTSTTQGLGTLGYLSSFRSISSLNISTGRLNVGEGVFSTVHVNMNPSDAPYWNSSNQAAGFDPEPNPLAVDVFGSMRVLKNIYIGSTTTVIGTTGILANIISSMQTVTSSLGLYNPATGSVKYVTLNSGGNLVVGGAQAGDVLSTQLISTTFGITSNTNVAFVSSINGLATFRYLSSAANLVSTGLLDSTLQSTVSGLNRLTPSDYIAIGKLNADQSLTADTDNVIQFADDYDPKSWYDPASYKFLPNVAGYYNVTFHVWFNTAATSNSQYNVQIRKNGNAQVISQLVQNTNVGATLEGVKVIYMNGSTDYLEFTAYVGNTSNTSALAQAGANSSGTYFTAFLLLSGANVAGASGSGTGDVVSTQLISTAGGLTSNLGVALGSTITNLGSFRYLSSATGLISTATLDSTLQSTIRGLGTLGYLSSAVTNLSGIVSTPLLDSTLQSTIRGLGTFGYLSAGTTTLISSPVLDSTLQSTVRGLGTVGYLSAGTTTLISSPVLDSTLQSTVRGLGTIGYLSSYVSSFNFLSAGIFLTSSIAANVVSTNSLFANNLVARSTNISSLYVSNLRVVQSYISSLSIDELQIGSGDGWTDTGPLRATYISSLQENTGALYATTVFVGNTSTLNQIRFWGLQGNYNNTILAEVSTGSAVGAQEFLVFKGSSASDRIRFQTTGDIRFEPQVAAREFSTATALATPTMILQSNLVGLNTASPTSLLDVRGTAFATTLSAQQLFLSSLNGIAFSNLISTSVFESSLQSTVRGLGTVGYLSAGTTTLISSPVLNSTLQSTVQGLGTFGYLSAGTTALVSTPFLNTTFQSSLTGLTTLGYVSSLSLQSSMIGMNNSFITSSLVVSSIAFGTDFGFLNLGNLQTDVLSSLRIFTSTIQIDASIYLYDKQLTNFGTIYLSNQTLYVNGNPITGGGGGGGAGDYSTAITSTTIGLGTLGYISTISGGGGGSGDVTSTNLTSTTLGLGTLGYKSTLSANIEFTTISTALITTSTITFIDLLTPARYDVFAQNSFLYYGSTIIGGAKTATPQFITF